MMPNEITVVKRKSFFTLGLVYALLALFLFSRMGSDVAWSRNVRNSRLLTLNAVICSACFLLPLSKTGLMWDWWIIALITSSIGVSLSMPKALWIVWSRLYEEP